MRKIIILIFIALVTLGTLRFLKRVYFISPYKKYAHLIPHTYRLGFSNLEKETENNELAVQGKIPAWLSGTLYRNGPAKFSESNSWLNHWFDGLAMLHSFSIKNGKILYSNKFLKSDAYEHVSEKHDMNFLGFDQNGGCAGLQWLHALFMQWPQITNGDVTIKKYSDSMVALTEIPLPVEFDKSTLKTVGAYKYDDKLPKTFIHTTAHTMYDNATKENIGFYTEFNPKPTLNLFSIKDGRQTREIIASINIKHPSYMHSFAITPRYAILSALPLIGYPFSWQIPKKTFIESYSWHPELGTYFHVIDRMNKKVIGSFKAEPFFAFHHVNAYEANNSIIVDVITYPDASLVYNRLDNILAPESAVKNYDVALYQGGKLQRFTIDLATANVHSKYFNVNNIELPNINYDAFNGNNYRYVYALHATPQATKTVHVGDALLKFDLEKNQHIIWHEDNCYPSEPFFVQKPKARHEDDGIIISVVLDVKKQKSFLIILDATNLKELARAYVPHHIPFGLHGYFESNR